MAKWLFPVPGGPRKWTDFGAPNEIQLGQGGDAFAIKGWLEAEVEAFQGLDRHQLCGPQRDIDPAGFPGVVFFAQQFVDGLDGADLALFELHQGVVQRLERPRHSQADQRPANTVQKLGHLLVPSAAMRRPTAS